MRPLLCKKIQQIQTHLLPPICLADHDKFTTLLHVPPICLADHDKFTTLLPPICLADHDIVYADIVTWLKRVRETP